MKKRRYRIEQKKLSKANNSINHNETKTTLLDITKDI